jgi:hypothetical protein
MLLSSHGIYVYNNWRPGRTGLGWTGLGWAAEQALVAFVPLVSIEDRPLHWTLGRSQTYYPEHILAYGGGKTR